MLLVWETKLTLFLIMPASLKLWSIFRMPKFLQSSAPKGRGSCKEQSWLYFWLRLAWICLHDLPVCSFACMNYLSVCLHELQSVSHSDSKRRCAHTYVSSSIHGKWTASFGCVPFVWSANIGHTHIHPVLSPATPRARAIFLFFTSLPPGSWEGSVVESIHQLSYLG